MSRSERYFSRLTVYVSVCHGITFWCCVPSWVTKILMPAIFNVHAGRIWPHANSPPRALKEKTLGSVRPSFRSVEDRVKIKLQHCVVPGGHRSVLRRKAYPSQTWFMSKRKKLSQKTVKKSKTRLHRSTVRDAVCEPLRKRWFHQQSESRCLCASTYNVVCILNIQITLFIMHLNSQLERFIALAFHTLVSHLCPLCRGAGGIILLKMGLA